MLRLLLWIVLVWIVWKIVKSFAGSPNEHAGDGRGSPSPPPRQQFRDIEDATFEDLTPDKDKKK